MKALLFALALVSTTPAVVHADVVETDQVAAVTIKVVIRANGSVALDGRDMINDNEIAERAKDAVRKSPKVTAVIQADKSVLYRRVIDVMDALKRGGVNDIAFSVAPP